MKVMALQYAPAWLDPQASHALVEEAIDRAEPPEGTFIVLPEMCDTGWCLEPEAVIGNDCVEWASNLARHHRIHLQVGFATRIPRPPGAANAALIVHPDGTRSPVYEKVHPFGFTKEPEHYAAGDRIVIEKVGPFRVAPSICYDLRFLELHRLAVMAGAEILAIGANWPRSRAAHWRALIVARAIENQAFVIAANRTGHDPSFKYGGGSLIVDPQGRVLAEGRDAPMMLEAEIDPHTLESWRSEFPALRDLHPRLLGEIEVADHD